MGLGEADGEPTFDRDIDVEIPGYAVAALITPDIADVGDEVIDVMPPSEETSRTKIVGFPGGGRVTCAEAQRRIGPTLTTARRSWTISCTRCFV
jgi:hypothetical protein